MSFLLVGQGRVGLHFRVFLEQADLPFEIWNRKTHSFDNLNEKIGRSSHILLAISDASIAPFYSTHMLAGKDKTWVHFSGSMEVPGVHSVHPLMTFGPMLYSLEKYRSIPFVTTSTKNLKELLPGLDNTLYRIKPDFKAKYHALCVLSGNFTTILWQKFIDELAQQDLPSELVRVFAEQTIKNVIDYPSSALTGPLARQDRQVQKMNLQALEGDRFAEVYQAFQFAYADFIEKRNRR